MSRSAADEAVRLLDDIFGAIYDDAFRGCGDASGAVRTPTGLRSPAQSACASTKVRDDPASIPTLRPWPVGEIQRSSIDLGCNLTRGHRPLVSRRARSTHHGPFGIMIFNSPNEPGTREPASHPGLLAGDLVVPDVAALTGSAGSLQQDAEVTAAVRGVGWDHPHRDYRRLEVLFSWPRAANCAVGAVVAGNGNVPELHSWTFVGGRENVPEKEFVKVAPRSADSWLGRAITAMTASARGSGPGSQRGRRAMRRRLAVAFRVRTAGPRGRFRQGPRPRPGPERRQRHRRRQVGPPQLDRARPHMHSSPSGPHTERIGAPGCRRRPCATAGRRTRHAGPWPPPVPPRNRRDGRRSRTASGMPARPLTRLSDRPRPAGKSVADDPLAGHHGGHGSVGSGARAE